MDLRGILGLSKEVRNGYQAIRIRFEAESDGTKEQMEQILKQATDRSAVFDVLTNGVSIDVGIANAAGM